MCIISSRTNLHNTAYANFSARKHNTRDKRQNLFDENMEPPLTGDIFMNLVIVILLYMHTYIHRLKSHKH